MTVPLVVGAGYIGEALARALVARGDTVRLATRSGTTVPGTTSITVDAADPDALAAQARGEIEVVEVRVSDYFGPGAGRNSQLGSAFFGPVLAGRSARIFGSATEPHSWCYRADIVATLIAAADHRGPWARVWHVPAAEPLSRAEIAERVNRLTGETGRVKALNPAFLRLLGFFVPFIRAANDSSSQFNRQFPVDPTETERLLAVQATPWAESLAAVIESHRAPVERADA